MAQATYIRELLPKVDREGAYSRATLWELDDPILVNGIPCDHVCVSSIALGPMDETMVFPVFDPDAGYGQAFGHRLDVFRPWVEPEEALQDIGYEVQ